MAEFIQTRTALLNPDHVAAARWLDDAAGGGRRLVVNLVDGTALSCYGDDAAALWAALTDVAQREPWQS